MGRPLSPITGVEPYDFNDLNLSLSKMLKSKVIFFIPSISLINDSGNCCSNGKNKTEVVCLLNPKINTKTVVITVPIKTIVNIFCLFSAIFTYLLPITFNLDIKIKDRAFFFTG